MNTELGYLNDLTWGYRASRVLQTAVRLKVFTRLDGGGQSSAALAAACSAQPDLLEKLLIVCCAMNLLTKDGDAYVNTALSSTYLVEGKPLYQGNIISHAARVWNFWDALPEAVYTQPPQEPADQSHRDFILGMRDITMAGRGQLFLEHIDLSGRKKLFDVGGGPGLYAVLACQQYPDLTATVFDLPETIAIARGIIQDAGLTDRIELAAGDWESDDFGSGSDVVLFSNVLHGPGSGALEKLQKAYAAMVSGGLVAVQEFALNDDKTGPLIGALFNVMVGAYAQAELLELLTRAGFTNARIVVQNESIGSTWLTAIKP
jgi:hypothetical protein